MPLFHYHALNDEGQPVSGTVDVADVQQAAAELQAKGLRIQSIAVANAESPEQSPTDSQTPTRTSRRSGETDIEQDVLKSHIATILQNGRSIAPALRAYAEELPPGWQRSQLVAACDVLTRGNPDEAAATLADLPEFWIPLLAAGKTSQDPGAVLTAFLEESQEASDLRQKWWLTLAYPLVLAGLALALMIALSVFVIPHFAQIFNEFDLELPPLTLLIVDVAEFLSSWGFLLFAAVALAFIILVLNANRWLPNAGMKRLREKFRLPFTRRTTIARFSRFLADLLDAGISVPDALRIAGFTVDQRRTRHAAWHLANDLEATGSFSQSLYRRPLSATVVYALASETPPAARLRLLREISNCQAERVRVGLSWSSGIIEPLAIMVVGFVVGCTVLGLFLPLVKLVEGLSM